MPPFIAVHPFLAGRTPEIPVFGHCPTKYYWSTSVFTTVGIYVPVLRFKSFVLRSVAADLKPTIFHQHRDPPVLRYFLYHTCVLHTDSGCGKIEAHI